MLLTPENSELLELEPIKYYTVPCSLGLGKSGNSLNSNSLFSSGHTIYAEQWATESSLQEGRVRQASRDEGGRAGLGAVAMQGESRTDPGFNISQYI